MLHLRGSHVDTATPTWEEELVDEVGSVRLDFLYIVLDGNGIPTISYTTPGLEVTTASRVAATGACILPVSAVSRKVHGGDPLKTFDVDLPLVGNPGIECRSGTPSGKDFQVVFTFPLAVNTVDGVLLASKDGLATADSPIINGKTVTVNLHNVTNAQTIGVTLTNVRHGTDIGDAGVAMGVLLGDVNASRVVNTGDTNLCKAQALQPLTSTNFRNDINASGVINTGDVNLIKQQALTSLP